MSVLLYCTVLLFLVDKPYGLYSIKEPNIIMTMVENPRTLLLSHGIKIREEVLLK